MPFYEYICSDAPGCPHCRQSFVVLQRLDDETLRHCPECATSIRRIISTPNVIGKGNDKLKTSNIEQAGFTQYRKIGKGVYEKSAGKGPKIISAD